MKIVAVMTCAFGALTAGIRSQNAEAIPVVREFALIKGAKVDGDPSSVSARISDIEVDTGTGLFASYAVEIQDNDKAGKRIVVVEARALAFAPRPGSFTICREDLDLTVLRSARLNRLSPPAANAPGKTDDGKQKASGEKQKEKEKAKTDRHGTESVEDRPEARADPQLCALSSLVDLPVLVAGKPFGVVEKLALEMQSGQLAFVGVGQRDAEGQRGDLLWVPWRASAIRVAADAKGSQNPATLEITSRHEDLGKAPTSAAGVLTDPLFRKHLYQYFAVEQPEYESQ